MTDVLNTLLSDISNTSPVEYIAVAFGLASVWYARKENILVFPTGIISVIIYVKLTYDIGLYADMGIQVVYFIMSIYGWYNWTHQNGEKKERKISRTNLPQKVYLTIAFVIFFFVIRFLLIHFTDSNVPNIDALTTAIFLIGMWLMALKKIENWTLWIIGDLISVPLYAYKGLVLTSMQYAIFLVLAVMGYLLWKKSIEKLEND